jgi:hypothetical protein
LKSFLKYFACLLIFTTVIADFCLAQRRNGVVENLPKFDRRPYHFGFLLGANQMNFALKTVSDMTQFDSLRSVTTKADFGFDIGIVSSLRISKYFSIRFIPTLSFGNRTVVFNLLYHDSATIQQVKKVESTFMTFPFYIKYQSKRLGNFMAYVEGGANYSIDLASQAKKRNKPGEAPIKLRSSDYMLVAGTGFDFFLPYFKFGIQIHMSYGLRNLLVPDNTIYTNSIKHLNSKIFSLSFTFEG